MFGNLAARMVGDEGPGRQTERVLRWVLAAVLIGWFAIFLGCLACVDQHHSRLCFLAVGLLASLMALALGGSLGLLFGLPVASKVLVIRADVASGQNDGQQDWFSDNTAMEQIVDWLTKIIVGLGLTQAAAIASQFDRIAGATTAAMGIDGRSFAHPDGGKVIGGMIIAAYLLIGFGGVFLWARRYLKQEWTDERNDRLKSQLSPEQAQTFMERSTATDTRQIKAKDSSAIGQAQAAVESANADVDGADPIGAPIIPAGPEDDPWARSFGGKSMAGGAALQATIASLPADPNLFAVTLILKGVDDESRRRLAGSAGRIYLHPTFPDPIRLLRFDAAGEIKLSLVCYGSFTVGAQLPGDVLLELDLAKLPGAPTEFRDR